MDGIIESAVQHLLKQDIQNDLAGASLKALLD